MSCHENTFRITDPLCRESSGHRWIYSTKSQSWGTFMLVLISFGKESRDRWDTRTLMWRHCNDIKSITASYNNDSHQQEQHWKSQRTVFYQYLKFNEHHTSWWLSDQIKGCRTRSSNLRRTHKVIWDTSASYTGKNQFNFNSKGRRSIK